MKRYFFFFCIILFFNRLYAQDVKTLFLNMPDSITPLLTATNKADFIDFLESNMKGVVKNRLEGNSEMTDLTADYIKIKMTEQSTWQMKQFITNEGKTIIGIITTACAPVCDSSVHFYTINWEELSPSDFLQIPGLNDFIQLPSTEDKNDFANLMLKIDMLLMQADFSQNDNTISFTFTTPQYLESEEVEKLTPYLKNLLIYQWNNSSFIR